MSRVVPISVCLALAASACAPSHRELFDPVASVVRDRTGVTPTWRDGDRPAAVTARVRELLAAPLTAATAAELAILNDAALQADYAALGVAGGALAAARTPRNPEVEAVLRYPLEGDGDPHLELNAFQSLTDLLVVWARSSAADAEVRAARHDAAAKTIARAAAARAAFAEAAAAAQAVTLRRSIADAADASAELARALRASGNMTELDLTRELLFEEESSLEVVEASDHASAARERLNTLLGLTGAETGWTTAEGLPAPPETLPPLDQLEHDAVAQSLGLAAHRARLEAAGEHIGVARLESFVPDVGVGVAYEQAEHGDTLGPAVHLSVPIFDWGQGRRASAWAELRGLRHAYAAAAVELRATARVARVRLEGAHARVTRLRRTVLPLRERLAAESVKQYNAMALSPFELLIIRREQIDAERRYLEALRDYWVADAAVAALRAGAMPEGDLR